MSSETLIQRIRRLTLEKLQAMSAARAASEAAKQASNDAEKTIVSDAQRIAAEQLREADEQLSTAHEEKRREELIATRPEVEKRVQRVRELTSVRASHARAAQRALEEFNEALLRLDNVSAELPLLERQRDPEARGQVALSLICSPLHSASRLRPALAGCVRETSYREAVRQPLHTPVEESFAEIEIASGRKLVAIFERDLARIDELARSQTSNEKQEEVAV